MKITHKTWGPLPFAEAARVWAAAAGIAGAYFPPVFADLAAEYLPEESSADAPVEILEELLSEAGGRAFWRARFGRAPEDGLPYGRPDGSFAEPRSAVIEAGRLVWRTSVDTVLCPAADGGWIVRIDGEHTERTRAAEQAFGDHDVGHTHAQTESGPRKGIGADKMTCDIRPPAPETEEDRALRVSCSVVASDLRRLLRELRDEVDRLPTPSAMMADELAAADLLRHRLRKALEGHRDAMDVARDEELPASGVTP